MDALTRRRFLIASGVTAGVAVAGGATAIGWKDIVNASRASPQVPGDAKILVNVTLYGGNDGLSTVVPAGDPAYAKARPNLAYSEDEVLPLGEGLGLNPKMKGFKSLWDAGHLAVVRGVSYPKPDHSHFKSMAIWQTASPAEPVRTGWLGRWLDRDGDDPLTAISIGSTLPPLLVGAKTAGASLPTQGLRIPKLLDPTLKSFATPTSADLGVSVRATSAFADLEKAKATLPGPPAKETPAPGDSPETSQQAGSAGDAGQLGSELAMVERCLRMNVPTRAYSVSLGGFDTHADEKNTQSDLVGTMDTAVSGFLSRIANLPVGRQVVVVVYSEFGRRVVANANQGTDHGTAGPVFVAGQPVKGGFYGEQPSLTDLDDGDLKANVDFRSVYGTVLEKVLGTDASPILSNHPGRVPFL